MSGGSVIGQSAVDVVLLSQPFRASRVRSQHGTFLCLSGSTLVHGFACDPADIVVLLRPADAGEFGLLHAARAFPLGEGGPPEPVHLVRLVPVAGTDPVMLCDPVGGACLLAYQDWLSNQGGPVGLGAPEPRALFSLDDDAPMPSAVDGETAAEIAALIALLESGDAADLGGPGAVCARLAGELHAARAVARTGAWTDAPTASGGLDMAPPSPAEPAGTGFPSIGPFPRSLALDIERIDPDQPATGWSALRKPNFSGNAAPNRTARLHATGRRAGLGFALPYRPTQARLRLGIDQVSRDTVMTVSANGWKLGRVAIGHHRATRKRLDFMIKGEAIQSNRLAVEIAFHPQPSPAEACAKPLFRLTACQLDLGPEAPAVAIPDDPAVLLDGFESIGENCEFGFLQRHFGVERLGLLTFAGVPHLADLVEMLEEGFAGLGSPGSVAAEERVFSVRARGLPPHDLSEFWITDHRYRLEMHSFKGSAHHDRGQAIRENEMKLRYLGRKLVEDLEDAAKILVFKDTGHTGLNDLLSLHDALTRYGPVQLFWVTHAAPGRPAGAVEWVAPGLLRGYSFNPHADVQWFNADHWLLLCRRAREAFLRAGRTV